MIRSFVSLTAVEQLARHLREEIRRGALSGEMPGINRLAVQLGCSARTVFAAVKQLEDEGVLQGQGTGRRSRIEAPDHSGPPVMRVKILLCEAGGEQDTSIIQVQHRLSEAGHTAVFASRSLRDLGMDVERVKRFVKSTEANAWVIVSASRAVLDWFAVQPVPAFALFGRQSAVDIAGTGPKQAPAVAAVVRLLTRLGHTRIVCLTRGECRAPSPGLFERVFLQELENQGIGVGSYHLPEWEDNPKGLHRCLTSLFQTTPPTALIAAGFELFTAAQQFLLQQGIRVPQDVSMVCGEPHPSFVWGTPTVSHIDFDSDLWVRQIVRWVDGVARGRNSRRKVFNPARFIEGGTVGPVAPPRRVATS